MRGVLYAEHIDRRRDDQGKRGFSASVLVHGLVVALSVLVLPTQCVNDYRLPEDSGATPVAAQVVKVEREEKKVILAKTGPISIIRPDVSMSGAVSTIRKESELIYVSVGDPASGLGRDGENAGYGGLLPGEIRFIRIAHSGPDWQDGGAGWGNADKNFLSGLKKVFGGQVHVASSGEAHAASALRAYRKGLAPPFVYLTGSAAIGLNSVDVKALREYLNDGGLLFADAGGPGFHKAIQALAPQLVPGKQLCRISDDDPLLRTPFYFPEGIDPLWAHGGRHMMGVKVRGRWAIIYHPGDLNDCWKDDAITLSSQTRSHAHRLGANVLHYAFMTYSSRHPQSLLK